MEKQRTTEWFEKRKGRVTGSNVGAILGLNPNKSADDVLREMVRAYHGYEREFQGNVATEWGNFNEDGAQSEYEMETGNQVQETGFHIHPEYDWLGASPDGLIGDDGVIEIKCPFGKRKDEAPEFKSAKEQEWYWAQMQIEMACTGRHFCDFYQWAPGGSALERVKFAPEWFESVLSDLKAFHELYLSELENEDHLKPKRKEINSAMADKLLTEYDELSDSIDYAKQRQKEIMDTLTSLAGDQDALVCGRKLTKVERAGSVSYAKVVKDKLPDVDLEPYRGKGSVFWRLS